MRRDADWLSRDHEIASGFQRLVSKRSLPDYFEVIKEPMAFSTIRVSLKSGIGHNDGND